MRSCSLAPRKDRSGAQLQVGQRVFVHYGVSVLTVGSLDPLQDDRATCCEM